MEIDLLQLMVPVKSQQTDQVVYEEEYRISVIKNHPYSILPYLSLFFEAYHHIFL